MIEKYEEFLTPTRDSIANHPLMAKLFQMDNYTLEKFLMYSASDGYKVTEPVEGWLNNAADRCKALGYDDLAKALYGHAKSESGHHLMRYRDLYKMIDRIYKIYGGIIFNMPKLLDEPLGEGAKLYVDLHNKIAQSDKPFLQFAIQYEIERLPPLYGTQMMAAYAQQLGPDILDAMEFMREHVVLDVGHTAFNKSHMTKILEKYPETLGDFVTTGIAALEAYKQTTIDIYEKAIA